MWCTCLFDFLWIAKAGYNAKFIQDTAMCMYSMRQMFMDERMGAHENEREKNTSTGIPWSMSMIGFVFFFLVFLVFSISIQ